jgi:hypothetical protein
MPPAITVVNTGASTIYGPYPEMEALSHPAAAHRFLSFWSGEAIDFTVRANDGRPHVLSLYNYFPGWRNPAFIIIRSTGGDVLDVRAIPDQSTGTYLTWQVEGEVGVRVVATNGLAFINGVFLDRVENPYADWERSRFTPSERLDPNVIGKGMDPDGDGYSNWSEYLLGRDPRAIDTQQPLWLSVENGKTLLHVLGADITPAAEITIEASADLLIWNSASDLELLETRRQDVMSERIFDTSGQRPLQSSGFFRLRLPPAPNN